MQPVLEKVNHTANESISIEVNVLPYFISAYHLHPEYEMIFIEEGYGTVFIGDAISDFRAGTVSFLGSNLPHVWLNDKKFYDPASTLVAKSLVIKFTGDCLGDVFFEKPEMAQIRRFFSESLRGIIFNPEPARDFARRMKAIAAAPAFERVLLFLETLHLMSVCADYRTMTSQGYEYASIPSETEIGRLDRIYKFVLENYTREISLSEIARVAHLTEAAFCRYFKTRTLKTFSRFVNEVRVGNACKMLIENTMDVSEIAYCNGFNYQSNFHKQFKTITGLTPMEYQRTYFRVD